MRVVRSGPVRDGAETAITPFSRGEVLSAQRRGHHRRPSSVLLTCVAGRPAPAVGSSWTAKLSLCGRAEQQRCAEGEEGDGLLDVCCFEVKPHARFGPRHLTSRCVPRAIDTRETSRRGGHDRCSTFSHSSSKLVACRTIPCSYVPDPVSWSIPRRWATSSAELRLLERDAQRSMPSKVPRISRSLPTQFPLIITALAWALCSMAIASPGHESAPPPPPRMGEAGRTYPGSAGRGSRAVL